MKAAAATPAWLLTPGHRLGVMRTDRPDCQDRQPRQVAKQGDRQRGRQTGRRTTNDFGFGEAIWHWGIINKFKDVSKSVSSSAFDTT